MDLGMKSLPPKAAKRFKIWCLRLLLLTVVALIAISCYVWEKLYHVYPQEFSGEVANAEFKYGSIGVEEDGGIPYWIWVVLPRIFPEYLPSPGGYTSLGILWEPGSEMPVGFSKRRIGYERVGINCAICHTGSYRTLSEVGVRSNTEIVVGGPAIRFDPQGYVTFLSACANDARFNPETILKAIQYNTQLSWDDQQLYRYLLIPGTKKALLKQEKEGRWMSQRPPWGPGRIDPFNPVKFGMLGMDAKNDSTIGNSDMLSLWSMDNRRVANGVHLHWDGLSTNLLDCSLAGALGDGATKKSLPVNKIAKLVDMLRKLPSPQYPLGVDTEVAAEGKAVFEKHCSSCHSPSGSEINKPVDWETNPSTKQHATDRHRLEMWNAKGSDGRAPYEIYNRFGDGYRWDLNSFVSTKGYISVPLNGIWARGPYLHNGSVPTIEDLLNPPASADEAFAFIQESDPNALEWLTQHYLNVEGPRLDRVELAAKADWLREVVNQVIERSREKGVRPPIFFRGGDFIDEKRLGFVADGSTYDGRSLLFPYVTLIPGNGNSGHLYGTDLNSSEKKSLIEFLKWDSVESSGGDRGR